MTYFADLSPCAKKELWATLALRYAGGIGARRAKQLIEHFGTAFAAVEAGLSSPDAWMSLGGITQRLSGDFAASHWRAKAKSEWLAIQKHNCSFLLWTDECYPEALRHIADAPLLLYYQGDLSLLRGPAVAVVGARNCTKEGVAVSAFFARGLSRAGVSVISGMARGIDRAAHLAAMEGPGRSIAVLGTGIDISYPHCNKDIYDQLNARGLLLSEFPPGAGALATHFPVRNRLISGLSQGVLVVEAAGKSGSLITARLALEQNRDVFAVPGHTMADVSAGCRELIRLGAKAVFNADDILQELAPLLTLEARKALENRQTETKYGAAHDPAHDPCMHAQNNAEPVLPEGGLPWIAASAPCGRAQRKDIRGLGAERPGGKKIRKVPSQTHTLHASFAAISSEPGACRPSPAPGRQSEASPPPLAASKDLNHEERRIIAGLSLQHMHIDALAHALDMPISKLSSLLTLLEIRGLVRHSPGMLYSLP